MIRLGAAFLSAAAVPVIATAAETAKGAHVNGPVIWHLLGYPFEAGSMIAALCACVAVRFYVVQHSTGANRWVLDIPVTALTLIFTTVIVVTMRPQPLTALLFGTGLGAIGAGLIRIAKKHVDRLLGETTSG